MVRPRLERRSTVPHLMNGTAEHWTETGTVCGTGAARSATFPHNPAARVGREWNDTRNGGGTRCSTDTRPQPHAMERLKRPQYARTRARDGTNAHKRILRLTGGRWVAAGVRHPLGVTESLATPKRDCGPGHFLDAKPNSISVRAAALLPIGGFWPLPHFSMRSTRSGGARKFNNGSFPVAGRPRFLGKTLIDFMANGSYLNLRQR